MNVNEKLQERGRIIAQMRAMLDKAETEKRDLTAEEDEKYKAMDKEQMSIKGAVDRHASLQRTEDEHGKPAAGIRGNPEKGSEKEASTAVQKSPRAEADYKNAFFAWVRGGNKHTSREVFAVLQKSAPADGGYLVPTDFQTNIIKKLFSANVMRQLGTVITTESDRVIPVESSLPSVAWIAENGAYPETQPGFGRISISAYKMGGVCRVSEELLEDAFFDIPNYLEERFGLSMGFTEEAAFIAGDGNGKPRGITLDVTTFTTTAAAGAIVGDELLTLYHSLKRPYRANASWLVNDGTILTLRKLKDQYGQYLWQPGLVAGVPDRLLGRPVYPSDYFPAIAANGVSALFGDFSYYQVADRGASGVQRLDELYALNGQVGFRYWRRVDGKLTQPDAVVGLKQAAS